MFQALFICRFSSVAIWSGMCRYQKTPVSRYDRAVRSGRRAPSLVVSCCSAPHSCSLLHIWRLTRRRWRSASATWRKSSTRSIFQKSFRAKTRPKVNTSLSVILFSILSIFKQYIYNCSGTMVFISKKSGLREFEVGK